MTRGLAGGQLHHTMSENKKPAAVKPGKAAALARLRKTIDAVDTKIHDLILKRADTVAAIAAAKGMGAGPDTGAVENAMRPGREAQILRRLAARHTGKLPLSVIFRVWREIISAKLALQAPFSLAVYSGDDAPDYWDLARAHFGSSAPMTPFAKANQVVQECAASTSVIGIVPAPGAEAPAARAWWTQLGRGEGVKPLVIARLPFIEGTSPSAFVIASAMPEESGDDLSLVAVEVEPDVSRGRLVGLLKAHGLEGAIIDGVNEDKRKSPALFLVQVPGFVPPGDPRLAQFAKAAREAVSFVALIGAYARPLAAKGST